MSTTFKGQEAPQACMVQTPPSTLLFNGFRLSLSAEELLVFTLPLPDNSQMKALRAANPDWFLTSARYETRRIPGGILHFSIDIKQRSVRYSRAMKLSGARARKLAGMRKTHGAGSGRPRSVGPLPVRRHDAGPGAAARASMWGRSKSKIVKRTAPGARQPVESAELYAVLAFHCGQGPMIRRRTSRQPTACRPRHQRRAARLCAAPARGGGAHRGALFGRITPEATVAAREANAPELSVWCLGHHAHVRHPQAGGRGDRQPAARARTGRRHRPREEREKHRRAHGKPAAGRRRCSRTRRTSRPPRGSAAAGAVRRVREHV